MNVLDRQHLNLQKAVSRVSQLEEIFLSKERNSEQILHQTMQARAQCAGVSAWLLPSRVCGACHMLFPDLQRV